MPALLAQVPVINRATLLLFLTLTTIQAVQVGIGFPTSEMWSLTFRVDG
jgi:hypothetical protein